MYLRLFLADDFGDQFGWNCAKFCAFRLPRLGALAYYGSEKNRGAARVLQLVVK
jgi:hypothetical protein